MRYRVLPVYVEAGNVQHAEALRIRYFPHKVFDRVLFADA